MITSAWHFVQYTPYTNIQYTIHTLISQKHNTDSHSVYFCSIQVVVSLFCPAAHPSVVSRRVSVSELLNSFILDLYRIHQCALHGGKSLSAVIFFSFFSLLKSAMLKSHFSLFVIPPLGIFDVFEHYLESDIIADVTCGDFDFPVTRAVFHSLYSAYGQAITNDGYFEQLVTRTWNSLGLMGYKERQEATKRSYRRKMQSSFHELK